jgi:hypothetical protein
VTVKAALALIGLLACKTDPERTSTSAAPCVPAIFDDVVDRGGCPNLRQDRIGAAWPYTRAA